MLSDQLDCKDSDDPLRLREFVKNYGPNGGQGSSLFRSLNNLISEEASSIIANQKMSEDVEMEEEAKQNEMHMPQSLKAVTEKLQQSFVQVMLRFV